mgnify:CR=1 FL=1
MARPGHSLSTGAGSESDGAAAGRFDFGHKMMRDLNETVKNEFSDEV